MTRQYTATITQRGQVTLPAEVRRLLGVGPKSTLIFEVDNGVVVVKRPRFTLEEVYGSVTPLNPEVDWRQAEREAREEHADRVFEKMRRD